MYGHKYSFLPFLSTHLFFLQEKPGQHVLIDGKEAIFLQRSPRSPQVGPKIVQKIKVCYGILTQPFLNLTVNFITPCTLPFLTHFPFRRSQWFPPQLAKGGRIVKKLLQ